jgi:hypothetical protein
MILLERSQEGVNRVLLRTAAEGALPALLAEQKSHTAILIQGDP